MTSEGGFSSEGDLRVRSKGNFRLQEIYADTQQVTEKMPWVPPILPYEQDFDREWHADWMSGNWTLSIWFSIFYVLAVFGGKRFMRNRKPFHLEKPLQMWNWSLAVFSVLGAVKVVPYLYISAKNEGLRGTVCVDRSGIDFFRSTIVWSWLFAYSKVVELGDTVFIILRKKPLIFLHWYHHITVLVYTWFAFSDVSPSGFWFIGMNFTVHAFMYTYYSLRSMSVKVPQFVSMALTLMQILQMVLGCFINYQAFVYKTSESGCQVTWSNLVSSFVMYGSYWALFCWFFHQAYIANRRLRSERKSISIVSMQSKDSAWEKDD